MSDLPKWIEEWDSEDGSPKIKEALRIAWEAMVSANRWKNIPGLSAESALAQVHIDLQTAMRRIEEIGNDGPKKTNNLTYEDTV